MSDVTRFLDRGPAGDAAAAAELLPLVYEELRRLAARQMAHETPGHTLQPTALVHEAWLHLAGDDQERWNNRQHFFRAAAEAMRHILVDQARQRNALKNGGHLHQTELSDSRHPHASPEDDLLAVHEALEQLARRDPVSADLVKLRYFAGLGMPEAAAALNLPLRSAERLWTFAKTWLRQEISDPHS